MRLADLYNTTLDELLGFHADSSDPLAFGDPRQPVKATVRRKERYPVSYTHLWPQNNLQGIFPAGY